MKNKPPLLGRSEACFYLPCSIHDLYYIKINGRITTERTIFLMELKEQVSKIFELGMSNNTFANNCGMSITTFNRWYKKGESLSLEMMDKIKNYVLWVKQHIASL